MSTIMACVLFFWAGGCGDPAQGRYDREDARVYRYERNDVPAIPRHKETAPASLADAPFPYPTPPWWYDSIQGHSNSNPQSSN